MGSFSPSILTSSAFEGAAINHLLLDDDFDSVRGIFIEGRAAYEGAGFADKSHIQVAVRNPGAIIGYFLPHLIN